MEYIINGKIKEIKSSHKAGLYFLYGALWSFSQVGYSFALLTWFTFIPFIFTIKYENNRSGFFYSWLFGFSVYLFHLWWMVNPIFNAITIGGNYPVYLNSIFWSCSILIYLIVCIYHGLLYAFIFLICKYISKNSSRIFYLSFPVVATVLDYFFPKLWHDQIGYSQFVFFHFSQIADIFGVPGITFLVVFCNTVVLLIIETFLYRKHIKFGVVIFILLIILIVGTSLYGFYRYKYVSKIIENVPKVKIGIVQGNFSGFDKEDKDKADDMILRYNKLSEDLIFKKPDLVIWPETAIPLLFDINNKDFSEIKKFDKVPLITGTHLFEIDKKNNIHFYNSLVLLSGKGEKISQYNKEKLLPFVENFPIPVFNIVLNIIGYNNFSKGKDNKVFEIGKIRAIANICYEDIIPDYIREKMNTNINLIINATNDSWYGNTIEPNMHLHMAGFRAIENRCSLIRATCTGYSAIFTPAGNIIYLSNLFKEEATVQEVNLLSGKTFYQSFGYLFVWVLAFFLIVLLIISYNRKIKYKNYKAKLIKKKIYKKNLQRMWYE